ncbi:MAG: tryptophan synthase subunit alpha [Oscillospiraceae bacterium]|jgi:tryptophan synthase alpha chain|nr:tryptophan synthase subunit alpha [Oscillospiraceae bacterium]
MNNGIGRLQGAFSRGKAFIGFVTGGDPNIAASERFILEMAEAGADIIEIGIPFSDPIAEGAVIQDANLRALASGATTDGMFELVRSVRKKSDVPIVFLTYLNPVFHMGYDRFFARARECGADGVIIPDLPFDEQGEVKAFARTHGLALISLIAPTSEERIRGIAADGDGFLYVVSSMGVTGVRSEITTDLPSIMTLVRANCDIPAAVGFGIGTPEQAAAIAGFSDGVIVGSAIVRIIARHGEEAAPHLRKYVEGMKKALQG